MARLGLAPFARLSYRLGFVLEATASASLGFAIAHDWYMDLQSFILLSIQLVVVGLLEASPEATSRFLNALVWSV